MRRVDLVAAAVAAALLLAGCSVAVPGSAAPAAAGSPACTRSVPVSGFTDAQKRFGITPPPGWVADTNRTYGSDVTFVAPAPAPVSGRAAAATFASSINVRVVATQADMQQAIAGVRQELKGLTSYVSTDDQVLTVGACVPAHLFGGTFTDLASGLKVRNLQVLTVAGGSAVIATGSALQDDWSAYTQPIDTAVRSLTVPS